VDKPRELEANQDADLKVDPTVKGQEPNEQMLKGTGKADDSSLLAA
jgi:hypothetical protein